MTNEVLTDQAALEVAIGQRVAELLKIKVNKLGLLNTSWGTKTIQGLGACILRIAEEEEENKRITE